MDRHMSVEKIGHHQRMCNLGVGVALLLVIGTPFTPLPGWAITAGVYLGVVPAGFGFAHYAMSRGYHWLWGLSALVGLLHLLLLLFVPLLLFALPNRYAPANEQTLEEETKPATDEPQP
jgi:hypothetical protein